MSHVVTQFSFTFTLHRYQTLYIQWSCVLLCDQPYHPTHQSYIFLHIHFWFPVSQYILWVFWKLLSFDLAMPVKNYLLKQGEGHMALAKTFLGANRHPEASREGEIHEATWPCHATSQCHLMRGCDGVLYKCYGIHSNEVLNKYFYYNPKDFVWMSRLTETPGCENTVCEIEQQLENEHDLDFRGLLSDKVIYIKGHWRPLGSTGACQWSKWGRTSPGRTDSRHYAIA